MADMTEEPIPDAPVAPVEPDAPVIDPGVPIPAPLVPKGERKAWKAKRVEDPEGESWHAEARRRWSAAEAVRPEEPISAYDPLPLPDFNAARPSHVSRDLLGRFLQDRDTGIVHDCHSATPECGIDGIRNGTFFHFWSEVLADPQEDTPCSLCIP